MRARARRRLVLLAAVAVVAAGAAIASAAWRSRTAPSARLPSGPAATWAAGERPAPDFALRDQDGHPVSLRALRGREVIVTFIDPLCRDFCPLEAKVLNDVAHQLPRDRRPRRAGRVEDDHALDAVRGHRE